MPDDEMVASLIEKIRVKACRSRGARTGFAGEYVITETLGCPNFSGVDSQPYAVDSG
jgi:hypothetical protein